MQSITPPDTFHLTSAIGWMELGNATEALADLEKLSPHLRQHPDVLETGWAIAALAKNWSAALAVSEQLVQVEPDRASGWLHRAYALRRVPGGGLSAAQAALLPAVEKFPHEVTVSYNLACYACQMGQMEEARAWLARARTLGKNAGLKKMALADPDLEALWSEVSAW